jgi:hypothetical protein
MPERTINTIPIIKLASFINLSFSALVLLRAN